MGFQAQPYRVEEALRLADELGLSRPIATTLVRRGYRSPDAARAFLSADEEHDPDRFDGMDEVTALVMAAVADGRQITVYGDFDVDGVAATSVLVGVIRELGGNCDWFIPDRIADGYGLSEETIRDLADRGSRLVITVDCGVNSVGPVALARQLGMEIVVTDHHQPGPDLPDCPLLHPEVSGYPFESLCGAAVASKLAISLRRAAGADPLGDEKDLDLVALATVADVMPLEGENRRLVRQGLAVARRAERIGLAALMAEARVDPVRLGAGDFGFRLGPRINAAGRMYRADAGVELFLAASRERADEIASELGRANIERRRVERLVENEAESARRELEEPDAAALVLAGKDWHPGVVGIVASRLVKKHGRPAVVISLSDGGGKGSARGVPGLDLLGAIASCSELLEGFGGHRAAAGLQVLPERVEPFRAALNEAVIEQIGPDPLEQEETADAFAGGGELGLELAEEIGLLAPFGRANSETSLLLPAARITDLRLMGEDKHCRFTVVTGSSRASGVCFGRTGFGIEESDPVDVLARLEVNHWNGTTTPQLQVKEVYPVPADDGEGTGNASGGNDSGGDASRNGAEGADAAIEQCAPDEWWRRFETEFARPADDFGPGNESAPPPGGGRGEGDRPEGERRVIGDPGMPGVLAAELISSGEGLAILTADALGRWLEFGGSSGLLRFRPPFDSGSTGPPAEPGLVWPGSPISALDRLAETDGGGLAIVDYECLGRRPGMVTAFANLLEIDPPPGPVAAAAGLAGEGRLFRATGEGALEFAELASASRDELTSELRLLYAAIRDGGDGAGIGGGQLRAVLSGEPVGAVPGKRIRSPEFSARLMRVLKEVGGARTEGSGDARTAGVVSSEKIDLKKSPTFAACARAHRERVRYLRQSNRPTS